MQCSGSRIGPEFNLARTVLHRPQQLPGALAAKISDLAARQTTRGEPLTGGMSGRICTQKGVDFFAAELVAFGRHRRADRAPKLKWMVAAEPKATSPN